MMPVREMKVSCARVFKEEIAACLEKKPAKADVAGGLDNEAADGHSHVFKPVRPGRRKYRSVNNNHQTFFVIFFVKHTDRLSC